MSRTLFLVIALYAVLFAVTGALVLALGNFPKSPLAAALESSTNVIYATHLFCWMVLGMAANYLWDLFRDGKSFRDIVLANLCLPILVSPIVFYGIWALVAPRGEHIYAEINIAWPLIAFQNGFFWQVILTKAGPVTIPPKP